MSENFTDTDIEVTGSGPSDPGVKLRLRHWRGDAQQGLCVLVHGFLAHRGWWNDIAPNLTGYRDIVALDLSGMGDSGHRAAYTVDAHVSEIAAVIQACRKDQEPVTLIAHSFGAGLAVRYASENPGALHELIALDTMFRLTPKDYREAPSFSGRTYPSLDQAVARFRLMPDQPVVRPEIVERIARESIEERPDGTYGWKFDANRAVSSPEANQMWNENASRYKAYSGAKRIIRGEFSDIMPADQVLALEAYLGLPGHVEIIPDAYHHLLLDNPEALVAELNRR